MKQCTDAPPCAHALHACRAAAIHGDMDQHTRMQTLHGFKEGKFHVLVATDVAARGLDIKSIKTVRAWYTGLTNSLLIINCKCMPWWASMQAIKTVRGPCREPPLTHRLLIISCKSMALSRRDMKAHQDGGPGPWPHKPCEPGCCQRRWRPHCLIPPRYFALNPPSLIMPPGPPGHQLRRRQGH